MDEFQAIRYFVGACLIIACTAIAFYFFHRAKHIEDELLKKVGELNAEQLNAIKAIQWKNMAIGWTFNIALIEFSFRWIWNRGSVVIEIIKLLTTGG